jgi:hypothetical protein
MMPLLDPHGGVWAFLVVLVIGILSLWILLGSRYRIGEVELIVVFGPLRLTYPFGKLVLVLKRGLLAQVSSFREPRLMLAFSSDNIIIETQPERLLRRVMISLEEREEFFAGATGENASGQCGRVLVSP